MSYGAIIGAIVGLIIAWLIVAFKSKFTYLGGGYGEFEGWGILKTLLLYLLLGIIGAIIGSILL
ncbi:hypothetical protein [Methanococcoides methylutens]|uniref:hypothetical protein n=1 Tax=Methanococcoides methylutens TaxID=2226 RepID=UPI00064E8BA2|nr:hypothetical protein [Methanococcoides methylutens]